MRALACLLVTACGASAAPPDAGGRIADAAADVAVASDGAPDLRGMADATVEEVGTFELPRVPADPALTRRIVEGAVTVVGGEAGCSRAGGWCAFSRPGASGSEELWAIDVGRALAGTTPPCDGTSDGCVRLTTALWTGTPFWGPSHPVAHRFEGDTLLFHTGPTSKSDRIFDGAIWAWRPGDKEPHQLTGDHALFCAGAGAVFCVDAAVVEGDAGNPFQPPVLRDFDLRAGAAAAPGPLPIVAHVHNAGTDAAWRARFSPDGAWLAYSNVAAPGDKETLRVLATADAGKTPPAAVLEDAAEWEISPDGKKVTFLRGYDRAAGDGATGTLTVADFPSGANATPIQPSVLWYTPIGAEAALLGYRRGSLTGTALLRSIARPDDLFVLDGKAHDVQASSDARHTLYYVDHPGAEFPIALLARSDGSGSCQLTSDWRAETYGSGFTDSGRSVTWIEYYRNQSQSEEGWYARPGGCDDKKKFGDYVAWYLLVGDDFVVFEGGDFGDTTTWLEYTPLAPGPGRQPPPALVIAEHPAPGVAVARTAAGVALLFSTASGGLYLHGPLRPAP